MKPRAERLPARGLQDEREWGKWEAHSRIQASKLFSEIDRHLLYRYLNTGILRLMTNDIATECVKALAAAGHKATTVRVGRGYEVSVEAPWLPLGGSTRVIKPAGLSGYGVDPVLVSDISMRSYYGY